MNEDKTKMTILRFIGVLFLPIFFGIKVVKKDSGYSSGWKTFTYIFIGMFIFAVIGSAVKGRKSKRVSSTSSYMYVMPDKKQS